MLAIVYERKVAPPELATQGLTMTISAQMTTQHQDQASALPSRKGSDAIVETLKQCDIEMMFGYSGGGTMFLINSMVTGNLRSVAGRTELGAAWMSYGYNRIKRRAASACLFHCVGMLHASPVVAAAKADSTPLVVLDVNLDSSLDVREGLQDSVEIYSALKPLAKSIRKIVTAEDLPLAVRQSVIAASTGRPGPAVLDLAFQILNQETKCRSEKLLLPEPPGTSDAAIERILKMAREARQPIVLAGAGVHLSDATAELLEFAELTGIPVVSTSWGGRGVMPDDHPLFAGVMGSFGWISANELAQRSDLWIAIGTTFSQMTTGAWTLDRPANTIHIDIDPNQLGKIFQPTVGVVGDARTVLRQLTDKGRSSARISRRAASDPWLQHMRDAKKEWFEYHDSLGNDSGSPINQYFLIREMSRALPEGSIVVGDSGGQAFMLYRSFVYRQATQMASGSRYMSLGASLPIAMGAKLAAPDKVVVSYHGDGGFFYDFSELSTAAQHGIKVIVVIDNNRCLLANRAGMRMWGFENPWVDLPDNTDFAGVAKALGADGERVTDPDNIAPALQRALEAPGPYVIDVITDPDTRIRRAIKDVVPILSDRPPSPGAERHMGPPLEDSWPN
jgi:acetolactate synthase-1/2/3 large subunit